MRASENGEKAQVLYGAGPYCDGLYGGKAVAKNREEFEADCGHSNNN